MKRVLSLKEGAFAPMALIAAGAAGVVGAPAAQAQQEEKAQGALEEIVVTARKRTESLQDTPVAISAMTGAMLEAAAVRDLSEASRFVPNLSLTKGGAIAGSSAAAAVFIRGVGQGDFIVSSDPGVGIYIDGVYHARMVGASMELAEVERVEVLRGPQGTLFGRNTIGGAINILSKQPEPDFSAYTSLTAGENDNYGVKAGVNLPLSEHVYARFSGMARERGGYVDALQYNDLQLGDEDVKSVRGQLRFDFDRVDVNLSVDYSEQNDHGAAWVAEEIVAPGADPTFNYLFASFANLFTGDPSCQSVAGQSTNPTCFGPVWKTNDRFATNNTFRDVATGELIEPYSDMQNYGASATVEADLGFGQFKSISAYRELDSGFTRSLSQTPLVTFENNTTTFDSEQYSQEFQLTGRTGQLDWVAGFYYFKEDAIEIDDLITSLFSRLADTFTVQNRSLALLANVTYHFTDRLHFTAGARWTDEKKDGVGKAPNFVDPGNGVLTPTYLASSQKLTEVTPSANLAFNFTPDVLGYVSYSEGFKSGTFSPRLPFPNLAGPSLPTADPEYVKSYEAGMKSDLFNGLARFNVALFYMKYDDIQIGYAPPSNPANTIAGNIAAAEIKGAEFELQSQIGDHLRLNASLGLMDAKFTHLDNLPTPFFSTKTPLERTPDYQGNVGLTYTIPISAGDIVLGTDWSFVGEQALYSDNAGYPLALQDAWSSGNVSVGYVAPDDRWRVTLYVENVTDEAHKTSAVDVTRDTFAVAEVVYNRPREVFATVTFNF
jgi:iron complex outermembrane recepter protein